MSRIVLILLLLANTAQAGTCLVKGYVKNYFGDGVGSASVKFQPRSSGPARDGSAFLLPVSKTVATDTTGYWQIAVTKTNSITTPQDSVFYDVWVSYKQGKTTKEVKVSPENGISIPDSTSVWLATWRVP